MISTFPPPSGSIAPRKAPRRSREKCAARAEAQGRPFFVWYAAETYCFTTPTCDSTPGWEGRNEFFFWSLDAEVDFPLLTVSALT